MFEIKGEYNMTDTSKDTVILVAEDNEDNYLFIESVLRLNNMGALWAKNGFEAVDIITGNSDISLILMDGMMPGMNGYEASASIRVLRPEIPIIILTAYVDTDSIHMAVKSGCNDYLSKPITSEILFATIKKWLPKP